MSYALSIAVILVLGLFTWIYRRLSFYKTKTDLAWDKLVQAAGLQNFFIFSKQEESELSTFRINNEHFNLDDITIYKSDIENEEIQLFIEEYNRLAEKYNRMVNQFPGNILAPLGSHQIRRKVILQDTPLIS